MENGNLSLEINDGVGVITFGHPNSNSLPSILLRKIADAFNQLSSDDNVRVILFQSEGTRAFCAGAALNELIAIQNEAEGLAFFSGFAHIINAIRKSSKLVIGRIQGKAVGGGVGLIGACDYTFATQESAVKLSEISIGIGPFVIEPTLRRKMGLAATSQLSIDATNWRNAEWAKQYGLFSEVYPSIEAMDEAINILVNKLSGYNQESLKALKQGFWEGTEHWDDLLIERAKLSGQLVLSEETQKALAKFRK